MLSVEEKLLCLEDRSPRDVRTDGSRLDGAKGYGNAVKRRVQRVFSKSEGEKSCYSGLTISIRCTMGRDDIS